MSFSTYSHTDVSDARKECLVSLPFNNGQKNGTFASERCGTGCRRCEIPATHGNLNFGRSEKPTRRHRRQQTFGNFKMRNKTGMLLKSQNEDAIVVNNDCPFSHQTRSPVPHNNTYGH
jgi:hypothetical protein